MKKNYDQMQTDTRLLSPSLSWPDNLVSGHVSAACLLALPHGFHARPPSQPASSGRAEETCLNLMCRYSSRHCGLVEHEQQSF